MAMLGIYGRGLRSTNASTIGAQHEHNHSKEINLFLLDTAAALQSSTWLSRLMSNGRHCPKNREPSIPPLAYNGVRIGGVVFYSTACTLSAYAVKNGIVSYLGCTRTSLCEALGKRRNNLLHFGIEVLAQLSFLVDLRQ
jgi:hypothetical protein